MKITHPVAIKSAALLLSTVVRAWFATLDFKEIVDDPAGHIREPEPRKLFLFWHEMMLLPAAMYARSNTPVLISQHRDGELITQVIRLMGLRAVRGSTNKQGMTALRELMREGQFGHLAITPDGPRGPRRYVSPGAIFLASRTGLQIVPAGFAFGNNWRAGSWDRMAFPVPGTTARVVISKPIVVPPHLDRDGLAHYRDVVQATFDHCQNRAQHLASRAAGTDPVKVADLTARPKKQKQPPVETSFE